MAEHTIDFNAKPQVNVSHPTSRRMWLISICAALAIIQSSISDSGASLVLAGSALCAAILAELLMTYNTYGFAKIKDGSAAASALVFTLLLPNTIHPVYAVFGALFAMIVVKHSFGGLGSNWLNPSLGAYLFIRFSWPGIFARSLEGSPLKFLTENIQAGAVDAPMQIIKMHSAVTSLDSTATGFLNKVIFSHIGSELPYGYIDLLFSRAPGIIADRGVLALLVGTIIITAFKIGRTWIPCVFLGTYGLLVFLFGGLSFEKLFFSGDILFAIFSGGTLAAAFIMSPDPATGAKSHFGILAAAMISAVLAFVFRYIGFEIYGALFAIALANTFTPILRFFETRYIYSHILRGGTQ